MLLIKYPHDTSNSNNKKIEGDILSLIQLSLAPNVFCEVSKSTKEMTKQLLERQEGLYQ